MSRYDPHSWTSHLFDVRGSLVREILGRVSLCVLWSALIVVAHKFAPDKYFDWEIPGTVHALVGGALALLLVFRTNSSYDRFWEGRKLWGGIVNETRNLTRQASVLMASKPEMVRETILWTIAFAYAAMHRLRGVKGISSVAVEIPTRLQAVDGQLRWVEEIGSIAAELPANEVAEVLRAQHTPLAVARQITVQLQQARNEGLITDIQQMALDQNVQLLIDFIGGCERIHSTPMPYAYAVHLRRALIAYCFTLPFALVATFGWDTIPAVLLVSYIYFGIEEIGVEIEDPFGEDENDLPLEEICATIERGLRDVLEGRGSRVES